VAPESVPGPIGTNSGDVVLTFVPTVCGSVARFQENAQDSDVVPARSAFRQLLI
jgi:hypothetical protein